MDEMTRPSQIQVILQMGTSPWGTHSTSFPYWGQCWTMEARELMVTRAVARRGSAEKSECPWSQRLEGDQITGISY